MVFPTPTSGVASAPAAWVLEYEIDGRKTPAP